MGMTITGLGEFQQKLKELERKAEEFNGEISIPFDELFDSIFMQKHTNFTSFDELLEAGNYVVNSNEDFEAIPDNEFDEHISKFTPFNTWTDMFENAMEIYVANKLGF